MAPQQAQEAKDVDHRADIYSLGLTLLFLLTGKRPYDGNTPYSIVLAHANKPLPRGIELGTDLPDEVEALIRRMAAKDREARYSNYDLLIEDVRRVKAGYAPVFKAFPPWRAISTSKVTWMVAGIVLVLVVAAAAWWSRSQRVRIANVRGGAPAEITQRSDALGEPRPEERFRGLPENPGPPPLGGEFDDRQGPPPRGRESRFPFPLQRLPAPNFTPLDDGPGDSM